MNHYENEKTLGVSPRIKAVIRNNNRILDVGVPTTTR